MQCPFFGNSFLRPAQVSPEDISAAVADAVDADKERLLSERWVLPALAATCVLVIALLITMMHAGFISEYTWLHAHVSGKLAASVPFGRHDGAEQAGCAVPRLQGALCCRCAFSTSYDF